MWPPNWGYYYWLSIHAGARAYRQKVLSEEETNGVDLFFKSLCPTLPCPACSLHCMDHISESPTRFENGDALWKYTVDFHNTVNKRTHKLELTYEDAEKRLSETLEKYKGETFLLEYWHVLLFSSMIFTRTPEACLEEERTVFVNLLRGSCYVFPFTHQFDSRRMLLDIVHRSSENINTKEDAIRLVNSMFNQTCTLFGFLPQTKEEFLQGFYQKFNHKQHLELIRAHQIREEDHAKMMALQAEMQTLRHSEDWHGRFWAVVILDIGLALLFLVWIISTRMLKKKKIGYDPIPNQRAAAF